MRPVKVIGLGMGPGDVTPRQAEAVAGADVLAGGPRLLDMFPEHTGRRLELKGPLEDWLTEVDRLSSRYGLAVLASGDPGFFGVADRLVERLGPDRVEILPNITSVQAAFARLKKPWQGVRVVSLHGRDLSDLWDALQDRAGGLYPARGARLITIRAKVRASPRKALPATSCCHRS